MACLAVAFPSAASAAAPCADARILPSKTNTGQVRAATLCLLNQERTSRGLAALSANRHLQKAARRYSQLMVSRRFFSHRSPRGSTLVTRVRRGTGYLRGSRSWALGENIAWGSGSRATPARTVRVWMNSPGHRRNILTARFRHIGIGIATGAPRSTNGLEAATYTTDFGRRS